MTTVLSDGLVLALVFVCAGLAAYLLQLGLRAGLGGRARTNVRFAELAEGTAPTELDLLRRRESGFAAWPPIVALTTLVLQSATRATPRQLALAFLFGALAVTVLLPVSLGLALRLLVGLIASGAAMYLYLRRRRSRRIGRFAEQLPDVIDVIVRSLRAGHPLPTSLALVAREMPEPSGPEFSILVDEVNYGRNLAEAMENLHARVGYAELRFMVAAVAIANQTGGNLGEILSRLAAMLRLRFRLRRRVRALSAEGRFSGIALSALPVILFGAINLVSPAYYAELWASPSASTILTVALAMLAIGNLIIYRMVNFRV